MFPAFFQRMVCRLESMQFRLPLLYGHQKSRVLGLPVVDRGLGHAEKLAEFGIGASPLCEEPGLRDHGRLELAGTTSFRCGLRRLLLRGFLLGAHVFSVLCFSPMAIWFHHEIWGNGGP